MAHYIEVQLIGFHRVERSGAHCDKVEDAKSRQVGLRVAQLAHVHEIVLIESDARRYQALAQARWPHPHNPSLVGDHSVGHTGIVVAHHHRIDFAHLVAPHRLFRDVVGIVQLDNHLSRHLKRVGKEGDVLRSEIVVAVVAQAVGYTRARHRQRVVADYCPLLHIPVALHVLVKHGVEFGGVGQILYLFDGLRMCKMHMVVDPRLPRIFLAIFQVVGCGGAVIAILAEHVLNHLHAEVGAHIGNEHWVFGKLPVDPPLQSFAVGRPVVVEPQSDRPRRADIG